MSSYIRRSLDPDRDFSWREDLEEVDHARTRRLAAKLFRVVRPALAAAPRRRGNVYVALAAVAWAAAMTLAGSEERNALDFFTLAPMQNLARVEAGNCNDHPQHALRRGRRPRSCTRSRGGGPRDNTNINCWSRE